MKLQCDAQTTDEKSAAQPEPSAAFFAAALLCLILEDTQVDDVVRFPLEYLGNTWLNHRVCVR